MLLQIPKPNPPSAWVEEEEKGGNYPQRTEWDLRSLLRGDGGCMLRECYGACDVETISLTSSDVL